MRQFKYQTCPTISFSGSLKGVYNELAPEPNLELETIKANRYKLRDWLSTYPLMLVVIDPYSAESSWLLETSRRLLDHYTPADIRTGWLCLSEAEGAEKFLGPLADEFLTLCDPKAKVASALGAEFAPSLCHVRSDGFTQSASGWNPTEWHKIAERISLILDWSTPIIAHDNDPSPYRGTVIAELT